MNIEEATQIVNEYISVKKREFESGSLYIPSSMLQYSKSDIATAIKTYLIAIMIDGKLTNAIWRNLGNEYVMLSHLIADKDAEIANKFFKLSEKIGNRANPEAAAEFADFETIADNACLIDDKASEEMLVLKKEYSAIGKITGYIDKEERTVCQFKLAGGDKITLFMSATRVKISKLGLLGLAPVKTIWESHNLQEMINLMPEADFPGSSLFDRFVMTLVHCQTINDVEQRLNRLPKI